MSDSAIRLTEFRASLDDLPEGIKVWVASLGWQLHDVTDISMHFCHEKAGTDQGWQLWRKTGKGNVAVWRGKELHSQRFVTADWQPVTDEGCTCNPPFYAAARY